MPRYPVGQSNDEQHLGGVRTALSPSPTNSLRAAASRASQTPCGLPRPPYLPLSVCACVSLFCRVGSLRLYHVPPRHRYCSCCDNHMYDYVLYSQKYAIPTTSSSEIVRAQAPQSFPSCMRSTVRLYPSHVDATGDLCQTTWTLKDLSDHCICCADSNHESTRSAVNPVSVGCICVRQTQSSVASTTRQSRTGISV